MTRAVFIALAALSALLCEADASPIRGRLLLQDVFSHESADSLAAALGARNRNDLLGDLRATWKPRRGAWSFNIAYEARFDAGDGPGYAADLDALHLLPPAPPPTWWDLTDTFAESRRLIADQKIDRLSVSYAGAHVVIRAGRQALTWGAGLVFHPMDLFDPYSPDATDTEYKPGTDMIYGQYLFDDGSDIQLVAVPRRARLGRRLTGDASSFAAHFRKAIGQLQTSWLLSRDHGDLTAGLAIAGPLGGAAWNAEVIPTALNGGGTKISALFNISNAGKAGGRDIRYFLEFYRNGFGVDARRYALSDLPPELVDRLLRGQVFNTSRDYLAAGAQYQLTPLCEVSPTVIANLNDASFYAIMQAAYSLADDLSLVGGAQIPIGPANSEFGGIALSRAPGPYFEQPMRLYIQLRAYF